MQDGFTVRQIASGRRDLRISTCRAGQAIATKAGRRSQPNSRWVGVKNAHLHSPECQAGFGTVLTQGFEHHGCPEEWRLRGAPGRDDPFPRSAPMRRAFGLDGLAGPRGCGRRRLIATAENPGVVGTILAHLARAQRPGPAPPGLNSGAPAASGEAVPSPGTLARTSSAPRTP